MNLKVGDSNPLLGNGCFFHYTPQLQGILQDFHYQEMARIYPPNAHNSKCQTFYFLTFSVERSKFLERTLFTRYISLNPTQGKIRKIVVTRCFFNVSVKRGEAGHASEPQLYP